MWWKTPNTRSPLCKLITASQASSQMGVFVAYVHGGPGLGIVGYGVHKHWRFIADGTVTIKYLISLLAD